MSRITVALLCLASVFALSGFWDAPADADADGFVASVDCNDADASIHPGAPEVCDGIDNDCDGAVDEGVAPVWYPDSDGDRYGDPHRAVAMCGPPPGYLPVAGDCDDTHDTVHPDAPEFCNGVDDNCSGEPDETVPTWYRDDDGDGWGVEASTWTRCEQPKGFCTAAGDCDDHNADIFPGHGCP
jgi:hypothetical protein